MSLVLSFFVVLILIGRFVIGGEIKKHVQNSVYPYDLDPPSYNIDSWVKQLHLQQCALVEVGDKYYAIFVESRPRRFDSEKGIKEYFLGLCDDDTLNKWSFCAANLQRKRAEDCNFYTRNMYNTRVHRRLCDLTLLAMNAPQCDCNTELLDEKLYKVQGFPTCFKPPLPTSLCGDNNVCGLAGCSPRTINKRVHSIKCDRKCNENQPFCEPCDKRSSLPRQIKSFWTDWSNPYCTDSSCISQFDEAVCINRETGHGDIDCLGPGTRCCTPELQNCKCHVYEEDGATKIFRTFSVSQPEQPEYMSEEDFINSIPLHYMKDKFHKYPEYLLRPIRANFGKSFKRTLANIYDSFPFKLGNIHRERKALNKFKSTFMRTHSIKKSSDSNNFKELNSKLSTKMISTNFATRIESTSRTNTTTSRSSSTNDSGSSSNTVFTTSVKSTIPFITMELTPVTTTSEIEEFLSYTTIPPMSISETPFVSLPNLGSSSTVSIEIDLYKELPSTLSLTPPPKPVTQEEAEKKVSVLEEVNASPLDTFTSSSAVLGPSESVTGLSGTKSSPGPANNYPVSVDTDLNGKLSSTSTLALPPKPVTQEEAEKSMSILEEVNASPLDTFTSSSAVFGSSESVTGLPRTKSSPSPASSYPVSVDTDLNGKFSSASTLALPPKPVTQEEAEKKVSILEEVDASPLNTFTSGSPVLQPGECVPCKKRHIPFIKPEINTNGIHRKSRIHHKGCKYNHNHLENSCFKKRRKGRDLIAMLYRTSNKYNSVDKKSKLRHVARSQFQRNMIHQPRKSTEVVEIYPWNTALDNLEVILDNVTEDTKRNYGISPRDKTLRKKLSFDLMFDDSKKKDTHHSRSYQKRPYRKRFLVKPPVKRQFIPKFNRATYEKIIPQLIIPFNGGTLDTPNDLQGNHRELNSHFEQHFYARTHEPCIKEEIPQFGYYLKTAYSSATTKKKEKFHSEMEDEDFITDENGLWVTTSRIRPSTQNTQMFQGGLWMEMRTKRMGLPKKNSFECMESNTWSTVEEVPSSSTVGVLNHDNPRNVHPIVSNTEFVIQEDDEEDALALEEKLDQISDESKENENDIQDKNKNPDDNHKILHNSICPDSSTTQICRRSNFDYVNPNMLEDEDENWHNEFNRHTPAPQANVDQPDTLEDEDLAHSVKKKPIDYEECLDLTHGFLDSKTVDTNKLKSAGVVKRYSKESSEEISDDEELNYDEDDDVALEYDEDDKEQKLTTIEYTKEKGENKGINAKIDNLKMIEGNAIDGNEVQETNKEIHSNSEGTNILLIVTLSGIKVCSPNETVVYMTHALRRISYATCDPDQRLFSFLAREPSGHFTQQYCHSFRAESAQQAEELNTIVGNAFRMAYAAQLQKQPSFQDVIASQLDQTHTSEKVLWSKELSNALKKEKPNSQMDVQLNNTDSSGVGGGLRLAPPSSIPGLKPTHKYNVLGPPDHKSNSEQSTPSSDESNSPTEMNSYKRIAEKPPLIKRLTMGFVNSHQEDDDSCPLVNNDRSLNSTPSSPTNRPLSGGYVNETVSDTERIKNHEENHNLPRIANLDEFKIKRISQISSSSSSSCAQNLTPTPPPLPERTDSLNNKEEGELRGAPWFQAGIPREIALEILAQEPVGAFMVRESTSKLGCFALSLRVPRNFQPTGIAHYLIVRTNKGYRIKGFTKEFATLASLITHHSVMPELLPCPLSLSRYNPSFVRNDSTRDFADIDLDPDYNTLADFRKMMADLNV